MQVRFTIKAAEVKIGDGRQGVRAFHEVAINEIQQKKTEYPFELSLKGRFRGVARPGQKQTSSEVIGLVVILNRLILFV